jgi:hypothetical protein
VASGVGQEQFYALRRDDWTQLLRISAAERPVHRDWVQTQGALRLALRCLYDDDTESLSDYMRASEARVLLERIEPDLRLAGYGVEGHTATGAAFWDEFVSTINGVAASL